MPLFTVIIPTHNHPFALKYSIKSVLNQTVQDFQLYVIGDGQNAETDQVMNDVCQWDDRIIYLPNDKGESFGEKYRHEVLLKAKSEFVAYLGDDDLWLSNHLETLLPALQVYDFTHTIHTNNHGSKHFSFLIDDIGFVETREVMFKKMYNFIGLSCAAHRLDSYHKLPFGWQPKPKEMWSDFFMWRQWLSLEDVRLKTIFSCTTLKLPSQERENFALKDRIKELSFWSDQIANPQFNIEINQRFQADLKYRLDSPFLERLQKSKKLFSHYKLNEARFIISKPVLTDYEKDQVTLLQEKIQKRRQSFQYKLIVKTSKLISGLVQ